MYWLKSGVPIYDPALPVSFHCPNCKKRYQLRASYAEQQTPKEFLPQFLSFQCPGCRTMIKAKVEQGHWLNDMSGQRSVYVLDQIDFA